MVVASGNGGAVLASCVDELRQNAGRVHGGPRVARGTESCRAIGGSQPRTDEDLGAVGAVGVPSAAEIPLDAEAVVDLGVVAFAQQCGVLQAGRAAVEPLQQMMDVAPVGGGAAAGEHAVPVPPLHRPADVGW